MLPLIIISGIAREGRTALDGNQDRQQKWGRYGGIRHLVTFGGVKLQLVIQDADNPRYAATKQQFICKVC